MKKTYLFFLVTFFSLGQLLYATGVNEDQEGETANLTGEFSISTNENASGGSFVKLKNVAPYGAMEVTFTDVPSAGTYKLEVYSYNGGSEVAADLTVNSNATTSVTLSPSNWAFEGPAQVTVLDVVLEAGTNTVTISATSSVGLSIDYVTLLENYNAYYFSADGDDNNDGSINSPWKTLAKATAISKQSNKGGLLNPGDKLLFRKGDTFEGQLVVLCSGSEGKPIEIGSYGTGELPILSGSGNIPTGDYLETVKLTNTSFITMDGLWIKNNRKNMGDITWGTNTAYGIKVIANKWGGVIQGLTFRNLKITDVFAINMLDFEGKFTLDYYTAKGIFFDADKDDLTVTPKLEIGINDVLIEDCYFYNLGSTAVSIRHLSNVVNNPIDEEERNINFVVRNSHFEKLGGDGVILSSVCNAIVEKNTFIDLGVGEKNVQDLFYGRGEGCWIWNTRNVVVQFNKQLRSRGFGDTYASGHVDFYCKNSIFQYNYSEDTEGGFVEILGECVNSTFRYNVSKNDGFRDHHGYTIWLSGYVGTGNDPVRSDSSFIYNNTVFYDQAGYKPDISIFAKNTYIYNNIFKVIDGAQVGAEEVMIDIENGSELIVDNNMFYGDIAPAFTNLDNNKIIGEDPVFVDETAGDIYGYQLQESSPAINSGRVLPEPSFPMAGKGIFENFSLYTAKDIYGNDVDVRNLIPNIGADNTFNSGYHKDDVRVSGVEVSGAGNAIEIGETVQLTASLLPSNATHKSVTWSSNDETIATVDQAGLVTAVANGNVVIKATTTDGGFTASTNVAVGVEPEVDLVINGGFEEGFNSEWSSWNNPQETSDAYEGNIAMAITTKGSLNQWIDVEKNTDYILSAYMKITDTSKRVVLGVNDAANKGLESKDIYSGVYKYHEVVFNSGNNETVKVYSWLPQSGSAVATVDNMKVVKKPTVYVPVTEVTVSAQVNPLFVGDDLVLSEDVLPNTASDKSVTWSSDNSAVATVFNGTVTAEGVGTANITVKTVDGEFTATTQVTVSPSSIEAFKNGDFEDGLNHWGTWQDITTTTSGAYEGAALRLNGVASCNQFVEVEPNTSYIFSGYVKVDNPSSERVVLGVNDENSNGIAFKNITNQNYTYHEVAFETGANQTTIKVYFWRPSGGTGYAYLDNAMLYKAPASSARKISAETLENELENLMVYPNPASNYITFRLENHKGEKSLEIFDLVGHSILQKQFDSSIKIPVSQLSKGTYIVIVTDQDGHRIPSRFIVK
ncbi:Ig-like domain-containing protein [Flammeovirga sp. SubArs3]|uniref:Ig-like domain-containing protein n=1 Tax=Flammeovirga sp. SubArs3 TaxID=2995316 RepID=UPI00248B838D|nr:Ig-like domain-containing protein [Flammeovirga sp. SubArs3]